MKQTKDIIDRRIISICIWSYVVLILLFASSCSSFKFARLLRNTAKCSDNVIYVLPDKCTKDSVMEYYSKFKEKIESKWEYPYEAAVDGMGGELKIGLAISRSGDIYCVNVLDSSGVDVLDKAALKAIFDASPFDPLPGCFDNNVYGIQSDFKYVHMGKRKSE